MDSSDSPTPSKPQPATSPVVVFGLLLLWALGLLGSGWTTIAVLRQAGYRSVSAKVDSVRYDSGAGARGVSVCGENRNPWQVFVSYSYEFDGKFYAASAYIADNQGQLFCDQDEARARTELLEKQGTVTAHVLPEDPQQAVLHKESPGWTLVQWALLVVTGVFVWRMLFRYLRRRRSTAQVE